MTDRVFTICFGVSLGAHLLLLAGKLFPLAWLTLPRPPTAVNVVYEQQAAQQELQRLQEQLTRAARQRSGAANATLGALNARPQIRIPDRPLLISPAQLEQVLPSPSAVVDLTNLADAARGNPVLLSYFSAIREQIQQTANRQEWPAEAAGQGLVYVSFLLAPSGAVRGLGVVPDRSTGSPALQDTALRIVRSAAPFPPFPPSMPEAGKTIVVPLEFLLAASGGG